VAPANAVPVQFVRPATMAEKQIPPEWEPHRFNGSEYYIIPLASKLNSEIDR
jgi:hypothetical protein